MTQIMAVIKFPIQIREGSSVVKIYQTPIPAKSGSKAYDAFTLSYHFGGKRIRKIFTDLATAKQEARDAVIKIANGDMGSSQLSPTQLRQYRSAVQLLSEFRDLSIEQALLEYTEAKKLMNGGNLLHAAQFFTKYGADKIVDVSTATAAKDLIDSLRQSKCGDYHIDAIKTRTEKFAEAFPRNISDITTDEINAWLRTLPGNERTQNNYRAAIVQLFNFARDTLKAIPHWMPHAAEQTLRVKEPAKDTEIYSCEEMGKILHSASPSLVPLLAIRAFSGIRNEELFKLTWDQVDMDSGFIKLKKAVTKMRARRIIPILPNLRAWLQPHAKKDGPVHAGYSSAKVLSEAISNAIRGANIAVKRNALRNCYTSYRLAVLSDIAKVSEETGNSPEVIRQEYLELVTPPEGQKWFEIFPESI